MKRIPLQLVTIQLEDGTEGIFIGIPLLKDAVSIKETQVSEVWFSNVSTIPYSMPASQLIELAQAQLQRCQGHLH